MLHRLEAIFWTDEIVLLRGIDMDYKKTENNKAKPKAISSGGIIMILLIISLILFFTF